MTPIAIAFPSAIRSTSTHSLAAVFSAGSKIRVPVTLAGQFKPPTSRNRSNSLRAMSQCAVSESSDAVAVTEKNSDVLVQYVVLRRDLIDSWPFGSVVTQGCHASVSAIWTNKDDPVTAAYCSPSNIDSMHKFYPVGIRIYNERTLKCLGGALVTMVTLEVKGETQIVNLSEKLKASGIKHNLWIEQPENIPTCLATKPYYKSTITSYFKKLKLCK